MLMLYQLIPLFASNIIAGILVFVILLAHTVPRSLRLTLTLTIISLMLWQDNIFFADQSLHYLVLWNTAIFLWPTSAILSCFYFIHYLHKRETSTRRNSRLTIPILIATIVQVIPTVSLQIFSSVENTAAGLEIGRSSGYYIYLAGLLVALGCLVAEIIVRRAKSAAHSTEHRAINIVLTTVVVAASYGVVVNVIVPLITGGQNFIDFGVGILDIFAIGLWLSIARGRLLDVRFYAVRTVVYIFSLATLVVTYAVFAFLLSQWVLGYNSSSVQGIVNIGLALVLAFIFQPVRRFFDRLTNKIFYRDSYNKDVFYSELSRTLSSTTELHILLERAATMIANTLKAEQAFFFVFYDDGSSRHTTAGTKQHAKLPVDDVRTLLTYAKQHNNSVIVGELLDEKSQLKKLFISHRIEMALPLQTSEGQLGLLVLGDQRSSGYTNRDVKTFQSISDELVIAIRNALSVQEVKDLNASLEQRIDSATKELRASNAQLQKLDEAKDEFISMASHQLRTPLTSIKGYISMLVEGDVGKVSPDQKHLLDEAFISSERMVRLIGDFLNVSRLQTGKFIIEKHPVNLAKVVAQEIESLEPNAAARGMKFSYHQPKEFPDLNVDESKIRQVIMNFADNAIYYSKEGKPIKIDLGVDKNAVVFTVKDTGIGVPDKEKEQLFNKFFRATNARKQRPDGTGVGLFLAKKVIDAHDGEVIFESKEGKGSTFGFRLPIK